MDFFLTINFNLIFIETLANKKHKTITPEIILFLSDLATPFVSGRWLYTHVDLDFTPLK